MSSKKESERLAGPQIMRRLDWVDLPPEYPDFKVRLWTNYPNRLWSEITARAPADATEAEAKAVEERTLAALKKIVVEHNGWCDFDGDPLPEADTDAFWEQIPTELAAVLIVMINQAASKLPNSLTPTRRR